MSTYNSYSYAPTTRGHIFQEMNTGNQYMLVRTGVTWNMATYNLVNMANGKARVSDINRLFTKNPDMSVTAAELSRHFGLDLQPVQHIADTKIDLPDLRVRAKIDSAVAAVREALEGVANLSSVRVILA